MHMFNAWRFVKESHLLIIFLGLDLLFLFVCVHG